MYIGHPVVSEQTDGRVLGLVHLPVGVLCVVVAASGDDEGWDSSPAFELCSHSQTTHGV
jgi:hypothetical protein